MRCKNKPRTSGMVSRNLLLDSKRSRPWPAARGRVRAPADCLDLTLQVPGFVLRGQHDSGICTESSTAYFRLLWSHSWHARRGIQSRQNGTSVFVFRAPSLPLAHPHPSRVFPETSGRLQGHLALEAPGRLTHAVQSDTRPLTAYLTLMQHDCLRL